MAQMLSDGIALDEGRIDLEEACQYADILEIDAFEIRYWDARSGKEKISDFAKHPNKGWGFLGGLEADEWKPIRAQVVFG